MPYAVSTQQLGVQLGVFISYIITARLGQYFAILDSSVSPFWIAAGVSLAAAWLFGRRIYIALFLATWVYNFSSDFRADASLLVALTTVLSCELGLRLCLWTAPDRDFFIRIRRISMLLFVVLPLTAVAAALVGPTLLYLDGKFPDLHSYLWGSLNWALGDLMGLYLVVPLAVSMKEFRFPKSKNRQMELVLILVCTALVSFSVFSPTINTGTPIEFLVIPFLLWLAIRFDPVWAGIGTLIVAAHAAPLTFAGGGALFLPGHPQKSLLLLDLFLGFSICFAFFSAAFVISRNRFEQQLIESEQRYRGMKESADRANAAKSDFLATISHEIRTPLTAILGYSEMIQGRSLSIEEEKNFLQRIQVNASHLKSLIDDVLDLSKIEAGKVELELCEFSVLSEVHRIVDAIHPASMGRPVNMQVNLVPGTRDRVVSDLTRFRQIIHNILGNALKFTPRGTITVEVSNPPAATPQHVQVVVTDTGIGMTSDEARRAFETFVQGDSSTNRRFGGTGLGLPLSRKLARCLGGDLKLIASAPGKGSSFGVTIAIRLDSLKGDGSSPVAVKRRSDLDKGPTEALRGKLKGLSILVAEDSPELRELIRLSLSVAAAEVDFACDGQQALEMIQTKAYDFIFMDLQMPRVDGYQAIQKLRALGMRIPIAALTARLTTSERERLAECGASDFLAKPFHFEDLVRIVEKHASRTDSARSSLH